MCHSPIQDRGISRALWWRCGREAGLELRLLDAVNRAARKISALSLSTPIFIQHQSIIATVQFIMPSPFEVKT